MRTGRRSQPYSYATGANFSSHFEGCVESPVLNTSCLPQNLLGAFFESDQYVAGSCDILPPSETKVSPFKYAPARLAMNRTVPAKSCSDPVRSFGRSVYSYSQNKMVREFLLNNKVRTCRTSVGWHLVRTCEVIFVPFCPVELFQCAHCLFSHLTRV